MVAPSYFHLSNALTLSWIFRFNQLTPRWPAAQAVRARELIEPFVKAANA